MSNLFSARDYARPTISNMPAIPRLIFRLAILQPEPRLLVAFLVQIMQQLRVGIARELLCQFVNACEQRQQARLRLGRRHRFDGGVQSHDGMEQIFFERSFHFQNGRWAAKAVTASVSGAKCPLKYQAVKNRSAPVSVTTTSELMKYNPSACAGSVCITMGTPW